MTNRYGIPLTYDDWKLASPPEGEPEPEIIECFGCDATADVSDFAYPTAYLLEQGWTPEPQFQEELTMYCPACTAELEKEETGTLVHFISAVAVMLAPAIILSAAVLLDNSDIAAIKGMLY